jgi:hypothetical protein
MAPARRPSLIRWGPVFAGAVIGLALMTLLSSLWVAWGFGTGEAAIADNFEWYVAGSAIVSLFVGGYLAGWLSGVRGTGPGVVHGLTVWALALVASILVGVPGSFQFIDTAAVDVTGPLTEVGANPLWAAFLSLLIGMVVAVLGGALGGASSSRPEWLYVVAGDEVVHDPDERLHGEGRAVTAERAPARTGGGSPSSTTGETTTPPAEPRS